MKATMQAILTGITFAIALSCGNAVAEEAPGQRMEAIEKQLNQLNSELSSKENSINELRKQVAELSQQLAKDTPVAKELPAVTEETGPSRFSFGGYGEVHANIIEGGDSSGSSNDTFDIHRLVFYVGYDFTDWIKFQSEIELEHALVSKKDNGEVEVEQAFVDFLLSDPLNIRVGRTLVPLGIINQNHEPPTFNGVERPNFEKYILPTTWWSDGIGLFGNFSDSLRYQAYVLGGLDGSKFSATDGIRDGRLKEQPSMNELALTFRLDYSPFLDYSMAILRNLRVGGALFQGGLDNGNKGKDPGVDGDITIYAADFTTRSGRLDLRGVTAFEKIDGAENIGNKVAEEMFGYYLEAAYHIMPDTWKTGLLKNSDALIFVRYDDYDTQYSMPEGVEADPSGDRYDWTFGVSFYPVRNLVLKTDYQIRKSAASVDPDNSINLGIGWQF